MGQYESTIIGTRNNTRVDNDTQLVLQKMQSPMSLEIAGESMYDQLENLVEEYGEVQIQFDSGEEAEIHRHNTEFVDRPMIKVVSPGEARWFSAEKIESFWIHYEF